MDTSAASAASLHRGRTHGEDKERRSNRMMAHSHRMNNDLSLLMVLGNSTVTISTRKCIISPGHWDGGKRKRKTKEMGPVSIECVMDLMRGVTFETLRITKSDSFPSVDWLQSDRHGKHHTHHRLAAKQVNKESPAHMPDAATWIRITKHTLKLTNALKIRFSPQNRGSFTQPNDRFQDHSTDFVFAGELSEQRQNIYSRREFHCVLGAGKMY